MKEKTCCFIGHRTIDDTPELRERLRSALTELIGTGTVNFLFGDHSAFNHVCYELVTELKETYPTIRRIHFRTNYEDPDADTLRLLTAGYEESVCPRGVGNAGRASYAERNEAMIRESDVCVFYYDENYRPSRRGSGRRRNSGTALAYRYAESENKVTINCFRPESV